MARVKKQSTHYVNNIEFTQMLIDYKESDYKDVKIWDKIGRVFLKIAKRKLTSGNWAGYSEDYLEEMCGQALLHMCRKIKAFDSNISMNGFAYFSEIAENQFKLFMKNQKRHSDFIVKVSWLNNLEDVSEGSDD